MSTSDIAADVVSSFEAGNDSGESADSSGGESQAAPAAAEAATPAIDPDDFDTTPAEVERFGKKQPNKIPHDRVAKMIAKREQKVIASIAKELGISKAEAELKLEDITGHITSSKTKYADYDQRFESYASVEKIMESNPDQFIRMLAQVNPEHYGRFVDFLDGKHQAAAPVQQAIGDNDPEPEPDYDLGDGRRTYSLEGMRKRDEWKERQIEKRLIAKLDEKLTPYEQERKRIAETAQKEQRLKEIHDAATQKVTETIERYSKKPGFKENEQAIQDAVINKGLSLEDAYHEVVFAKFQQSEQQIREKVVKEQNAQPRSTSVATNPAAARATKSSQGVDTRAIAAEEIRKAFGS